MYQEGDEVINIYFMQKGECGYVIPKFNNTQFISINCGNEFGMEDIAGCLFINEWLDENDWISSKDKLKRQFTIMAEDTSTLLTLSVNDINRMRLEFLEAYQKLLEKSLSRLESALVIKLECFAHCNDRIENCNVEVDDLGNLDFDFQPFSLKELDNDSTETPFSKKTENEQSYSPKSSSSSLKQG